MTYVIAFNAENNHPFNYDCGFTLGIENVSLFESLEEAQNEIERYYWDNSDTNYSFTTIVKFIELNLQDCTAHNLGTKRLTIGGVNWTNE